MKGRRLVTLVTAWALALGLGAAPAVAGAPTEMSVYPTTFEMDYCFEDPRMYWTLTLWGGTSGNFTWSVTYGDGHSSGPKTAPGPWAEVDTYHVFNCGPLYYQYWTASRSGGGVTHYNTHVNTD